MVDLLIEGGTAREWPDRRIIENGDVVVDGGEIVGVGQNAGDGREAGKRADLLVLDLDYPRLTPRENLAEEAAERARAVAERAGMDGMFEREWTSRSSR